MTAGRWIVAAIAIALTAVQTYFSATTGGMLIPLLLGLGIVITASVAMSRLSPLLVPAVAVCSPPGRAAHRSPRWRWRTCATRSAAPPPARRQ